MIAPVPRVALAPGTRIGPYEIAARIGVGGMGEVYQARDTNLKRAVALKVLPDAVAADAERLARFQREAEVLASLNHPNIVTIAGLDIDRIISIGEAVADALAAAHDRGIIHRDLKPANVMVTKDGRVKVLDFGLAKVQGPDAGDATRAELPTAMVTAAGMVMGTRPYMSPEQVQARALDRRTDIFSLGVMLYEMATGRRPFQGPSPAELFASILRDPTRLVSDLRTDLPSDLARAIQCCLEKDPTDRMQTARDVGHALRNSTRSARRASFEQRRPSSGQARADEGFWVAVLPFKYSGPDAALTTLAEGLSEEIVTGLSRFSYLRVIARSSTSRYGDQAVDVRTVGQQLGAHYVMEGSLRQAGASLRVAVQVVDATSGAHLWAETYNRAFDPAEIFTLQDDLVPRIVSTVADWYGVLPHSMSEAVRSKPIDQLSPYEALLRAFGYYERVTPEEHAVARPILERAVKEAPGHGAAWAMLSMLYGEEHRFEFNVEPDPLGRALLAARRAVETAPSSHVSYLALAQAHYFRKEFEAFRSAAERAVAQNPLDGATVEYLGHLLAFSGNWERGRELGDRARQLNANHPSWYWALPLLDADRAGDYQAARALAPKAPMPGQ